eukprot:1553467-Prymnesium_polylepis.1
MCRKPGLELGECPATARLYGITVHHTHTASPAAARERAPPAAHPNLPEGALLPEQGGAGALTL